MNEGNIRQLIAHYMDPANPIKHWGYDCCISGVTAKLLGRVVRNIATDELAIWLGVDYNVAYAIVYPFYEHRPNRHGIIQEGAYQINGHFWGEPEVHYNKQLVVGMLQNLIALNGQLKWPDVELPPIVYVTAQA